MISGRSKREVGEMQYMSSLLLHRLVSACLPPPPPAAAAAPPPPPRADMALGSGEFASFL